MVPRGVEYLWDRFWMVCSGQAPTMVEIKAFADITHWAITGFELEAMIAMGREFSSVIDERARARAKEK